MAEIDSTPRVSPGPAVKALSAELVHASDAKILKVLQMIDMLPDRGATDDLVAPVRSRLAVLRPTRPMTRTRLLFTPLDALVVGPAGWQPGDLAIPRSIIQPLASLLLPKIPGALPPGMDDADDAALTRAGAPLWAAAAEHLQALELPDEWSMPKWQKTHGLTASAVVQLAGALHVALRHAVALRSLPPPQDPEREQALTVLLSDAAEAGPLAWGIMLALLLDGAAPDQVVRSATAIARRYRSAAALLAGIDQATSDTLGRMEDAVEASAPNDLLDAVRMPARVALISRIERFRQLELRAAPEQRRLGRLRQAVSAASRQVFESTLQARLPSPAPATEPLGPEAVGRLETDARQLRRFALAASRLGDGDDYARMLEEAASRYLAGGVAAGLLAADCLRLTELLVGSERAVEIMDRR